MKNRLGLLVILSLVFAGPEVLAKKNPNPPERGILHNNQGVTALINGDYDKALFEFKTACELAPKYPEAWSNLGSAFTYKGRYEEAKEALEKAIDLDRKYAAPYNHMGHVYYKLKDYTTALDYFKKALKYNSKYSDAAYNSGLVHLALYQKSNARDDLNNAIEAWQKATTLNAEHPYAHFELAKAYQEINDYENAIIRYRLALEINPALTNAWLSLADLYTKTGDTLKAEQALNKVMDQTEVPTEAHIQFGLNYLKEENFEMAIQEFHQAISFDPSHDLAYYNIGYTYFKKYEKAQKEGQAEAAQTALIKSSQAFESAFKLRPTYKEAAYNLGYNFQLMRNPTQALDWYRRALEIDKNFAGAHFAIGTLHESTGDKKGAAASFCTYLKLTPKGTDPKINLAQTFVKSVGGCP